MDLSEAYIERRLAFQEALGAVKDARTALADGLRATAMSDHEIGAILEAFERDASPTFGAAQIYADAAGPGGVNPLFARMAAETRQAVDRALAAGVDERLFSSFTASVKDYHEANGVMKRHQTALYATGRGQAVEAAEAEAGRYQLVQDEILAAARQINPNVSVKTQMGLISGEDGSFDPLKRVMAVSLDMSRLDPRHDAYKGLWQSVEGLLTEKERGLLDAHYEGTRFEREEAGRGGPDALATAPGDRLERAAADFAAFFAPASNRKPPKALERAFKPLRDFLERTANVVKGHGFQMVEDVWRKAGSGVLAARAEGKPGLEIPHPGENKAGHQRFKDSLAKMSTAELAQALRAQERALFEAREKKMGLFYGAKLAMARAVYGSSNPGRATRLTIKQRVLAAALPFVKGVRDESARHDKLVRGFAALKAAQRHRLDRSAGRDQGSTKSEGPDDPRRGPTGPGGGLDAVIRSMEHQMAARGLAVLDGGKGTYTVSDAVGPGPDGRMYRYDVELNGERIGLANGHGPAAEMIAALENDGVQMQGRASMHGNTLAVQATQAGPDDIKTIRASGLLDERLNKLLDEKQVYALVYPLKTGDVVFQLDDGRWRAGTMNEFHAYAEAKKNPHLQAAAAEIAKAAESPGRSPSGPAAARPAPERPRNRGLDATARSKDARGEEKRVVDLRTKTAAAYSAGLDAAGQAYSAGAVKVDPESPDHTASAQVKAQIEGLDSAQVTDVHRATQAALAAARQGGAGTPAEIRHVQQLREGLNALRAEMREMGIPVPQDPTRTKEKQKAHNQGR